MKAFADEKLNVSKRMISLFDRVVTSIFSFSHRVFQSLLLEGRLELGLYSKELTLYRIMPTFNDPEEVVFLKH